MARFGILTGGGDCPGLNAVIRAAVLNGIKTYDFEMVGIRNGWSGLIEKDVEDLPRSRVRGLARTGGTILGVVPKSYLPTYREFYERRHFAPGDDRAGAAH